MADIIEFQNALLPLNLLFLQGVGVPDASHWRLENSLNHGYVVDGLSAVPQLVATRRDGHVLVVGVRFGQASGVSEESEVKVLLDAAIVRRSLERCGRAVSQVDTWIVTLSHNNQVHRVEYEAESGYYDMLFDRAQQILKDKKIAAARADEISQLL